MKRKLLFLWLLITIFLTSCSTLKDKSYYTKFKNPNLAYDWDFNRSHSDGGHTFNSTYFQIKKYNVFQEIFLLRIPYEIQYKHEEGHIYLNQLLNIKNFDYFESNTFESLNLTDHDSYRQYMISVSEGIADFYVINYFNNTLSDEYNRYIEKNKKDGVSGFKQHYQGIKYINYSLKMGIYPNFTELILDLGLKNQYISYSNYLKMLWG